MKFLFSTLVLTTLIGFCGAFWFFVYHFLTGCH